ncbi:RNA polymerase sigma factor [Maridesulfovibrio salexigens]|uniref:Transcriptional regulator, LuxR family n=1 Tax=Maridesulfovibrio salexigens (strain ATCC 14822 / DSM 2638 / NCIMB 8403 / VKM B-1763) TaxID=526222 RepID=C6BZU7_MARSD|nr:sigma-70 family RNA polymerase sigma factor [Maridesulfovibrio salexigens]ACS79004.1 transcriptional regulator, LuxR family [Maridesulfovibrio salexigens DSM 2638]
MNTYIEQKYEYISEKEMSCFFNENINFIKNVVSKFIFSKYVGANKNDVDEVCQEVAVKIIKNDYIAKYSSEKSSINTWLYIISRSVAVDYMRKNNRIYINVDDLDQISEPENEKIDFNFPEDILSKRQKEVVRMIFWGDLKAVEVAEQLGITSRTVRCIKHQAIQKLRRHFSAASERRVVS